MRIYTDGACSPNPGLGGYAFAIFKDNEDTLIKEGSGYELSTTNQRMELIAVLEGLSAINIEDIQENIYVFSDSAYLINCINQHWWEKWKYNGWRTAKKEEVLNQDLWKQLIPFFMNPKIIFNKVKGHDNDKFNNYVDKLAVQARLSLKNEG